MDALCGAECSAELARQAAAGAQALAEASAPALESAVKAAPAVAGSAAQVAGTAAQGLFKLGWKSVEIAGPVVVEGTKAALPVVSEATRAALPAAQRALEDPASVQQGLADTLTAIELPSADRVVEGTTASSPRRSAEASYPLPSPFQVFFTFSLALPCPAVGIANAAWLL